MSAPSGRCADDGDVKTLTSVADPLAGPFPNPFMQFDPDVVEGILADATRICEDETDRRLTPFTGLVESHRMGRTTA